MENLSCEAATTGIKKEGDKAVTGGPGQPSYQAGPQQHKGCKAEAETRVIMNRHTTMWILTQSGARTLYGCALTLYFDILILQDSEWVL